MKLKIYDFKGDLSTLNQSLTIDSIEGLELINPVEVKYSINKLYVEGIGDVYEISGEYSGALKQECVRCLKEITQKVNGEFNSKLLDPKSYKLYIKSLEEEKEIDLGSYEEALNGEIDIIEMVREQILLDQDPYPICSPNCEDDSEIKKYADDGIDQRWAKLLEI